MVRAWGEDGVTRYEEIEDANHFTVIAPLRIRIRWCNAYPNWPRKSHAMSEPAPPRNTTLNLIRSGVGALDHARSPHAPRSGLIDRPGSPSTTSCVISGRAPAPERRTVDDAISERPAILRQARARSARDADELRLQLPTATRAHGRKRSHAA